MSHLKCGHTACWSLGHKPSESSIKPPLFSHHSESQSWPAAQRFTSWPWCAILNQICGCISTITSAAFYFPYVYGRETPLGQIWSKSRGDGRSWRRFGGVWEVKVTEDLWELNKIYLFIKSSGMLWRCVIWNLPRTVDHIFFLARVLLGRHDTYGLTFPLNSLVHV